MLDKQRQKSKQKQRYKSNVKVKSEIKLSELVEQNTKAQWKQPREDKLSNESVNDTEQKRFNHKVLKVIKVQTSFIDAIRQKLVKRQHLIHQQKIVGTAFKSYFFEQHLNRLVEQRVNREKIVKQQDKHGQKIDFVFGHD